MLTYRNHNANPKGRKTGDCSTRALVECLGISYEDALMRQFQASLKSGYDPTSRKVIELVLQDFGYVKMRQPRKLDRTKFQVCEMDSVVSLAARHHGIICNVSHHYVAIKGNSYIDIWDSGHKAVGNYYMKV